MAVLIFAGVGALAEPLSLCLRGRAREPVDFAASFVLVTATLCALLHGITWFGLRHLVWVTRLAGWGLAILGLIALCRLVSVARAKRRLGLRWYRQQTLYVRLAMALAGVTLVGYLAATLGPATDIDSLDYHLGVPLDWLLHGGAYPRPDWLHARLVGLGEMINMLGLAAGTDSLGAVFQFGGLLIAAVGVDAFAEGVGDRVLGILLVVGCPVMLSLVPIQKPELLPAAATAVALVMLVERWGQLDISTTVLAFGCVAFAMACKYSFLLTGVVALAVGLVAARRSRSMPSALAIGALALIVLPGQVWARNLVFYHDPISPLLERFKPAGDPYVVGFADLLRVAPDLVKVSVGRLLLLPWQLTATVRLGEVPTILGLGTFAFILALRNVRTRVLVLAAAGATLLIVSVCMLQTRFFLEPYLWCAAAAVGAPDSGFKSAMRSGLLAQTGIVAALALFLGVTLFPGALTLGLRDHVMSAAADGYQATKWLNTVLPADAVVLTHLRSSHALLGRRFVVFDTWYASYPMDVRKERLLRLLDANQPTLAVAPYTFSTSYYPGLVACSGARLYGPATFRGRGHNPFRNDTYTVQVVRLELNGPACRNGD